LYQSQAIVDPSWLASTLVKPIRPYWITPQHYEAPTIFPEDCYSIICMNCSEYQPKSAWKETKSFFYSAGAADDHESWARNLNPRLFWDNLPAILDKPDTEDATDIAIDSLVQRELEENESFERNMDTSSPECLFDAIGSTKIFVGTRRAGRPPECWQHFDAILNVTDMEYPDIVNSCCQNSEPIKRSDEVGGELRSSLFYLQLPVSEGKRDKSELERWMAVGMVFVFMHAKQKRNVLIHCAQGKDRSVAMAIAVVAIFCDLRFPLRWNEDFWSLSLESLLQQNDDDALYVCSGLSRNLVHRMLGREGRDLLFMWVREEVCHRPNDTPLATKETLRVALLLIQQDREKADPSRSTMQKLNRFFMS
jgi:Rit1 N-terminal domain/Rit1 DUSP-like domain